MKNEVCSSSQCKAGWKLQGRLPKSKHESEDGKPQKSKKPKQKIQLVFAHTLRAHARTRLCTDARSLACTQITLKRDGHTASADKDSKAAKRHPHTLTRKRVARTHAWMDRLKRARKGSEEGSEIKIKKIKKSKFSKEVPEANRVGSRDES